MGTNSKAVERALSLILNDPHFIASPKSADFLSFVVSTTLKGDGHRLKAYTIAVDALDKPDSFDPQQDLAVRVIASRIRKALDLYNSTIELIQSREIMKKGALIYIETPLNSEIAIPLNWQVLKEKVAGQVRFGIYKNTRQ